MSRFEEILTAIINGDDVSLLLPPETRGEILLQALLEKFNKKEWRLFGSFNPTAVDSVEIDVSTNENDEALSATEILIYNDLGATGDNAEATALSMEINGVTYTAITAGCEGIRAAEGKSSFQVTLLPKSMIISSRGMDTDPVATTKQLDQIVMLDTPIEKITSLKLLSNTVGVHFASDVVYNVFIRG